MKDEPDIQLSRQHHIWCCWSVHALLHNVCCALLLPCTTLCCSPLLRCCGGLVNGLAPLAVGAGHSYRQAQGSSEHKHNVSRIQANCMVVYMEQLLPSCTLSPIFDQPTCRVEASLVAATPGDPEQARIPACKRGAVCKLIACWVKIRRWLLSTHCDLFQVFVLMPATAHSAGAGGRSSAAVGMAQQAAPLAAGAPAAAAGAARRTTSDASLRS